MHSTKENTEPVRGVSHHHPVSGTVMDSPCSFASLNGRYGVRGSGDRSVISVISQGAGKQ